MSLLYGAKAYVRNKLRSARITPRKQPDRCTRLLIHYGIDVVLDVGASNGQFGRRLLDGGYRNRIVSFEPLTSAESKLRANALGVPNWTTAKLALGAENGDAVINVAGRSQSSSLLPMQPLHVEAAPGTAYVGTEPVTIRTLDSIIDDYCSEQDTCFLKLDVQGYEKAVLDGATRALDRCVGLQLEMSLASLYVGETLFPDLVQLVTDLGFCLMGMETAFRHARTQHVLQLDGLFYTKAFIEDHQGIGGDE